MRNTKYLLEGKKPVPCSDQFAWAAAFDKMDRKVAQTKVGDIWVSTVFLGLDHQFGDGDPLLFETMTFRGVHADTQERYSTWKQAEAGHLRWVEKVKASETKKD